MKRLSVLLLALCLLLCACHKEVPAQTSEPTETAPTTQATEPTTEETTAPVETTPKEVLRHPLTGRELDYPFTGRVALFSINNAPAAMPQSGISGADWLYEIETEGGVTRCLGLFTDFTDVGNLGPIRSARTYFSNINLSYDGVLFHCGGSNQALSKMYDESHSFSVWNHINEMEYGKYFFRASRPGYAFEHTLYTTGENAAQAMTDLGYYDTDDKVLDYGLSFAEDVVLGGDAATKITVEFQGSKTTGMNYDPETKRYSAREYGGGWMDQNTGSAVSFTNVLVIQAEQRKPSGYQSFYTLIGEGTGYLATGGQIVPIQWSREDVNSPFRYTVGGQPITLSVGTTYCAVVSYRGSVSYS